MSSVDSGNLAAHLIAAANACREWITAPITNAAHLNGVADAAQLAADALLALPDDRRTQTLTRHQLADALSGIDATLRSRR